MFLRRERRTTEPPASHTEDDCLAAVRPLFNDAEVTRDVFNCLRRSGLTQDQAIDGMEEMNRSYIIFGKLFGASELDLRRLMIAEKIKDERSTKTNFAYSSGRV